MRQRQFIRVIFLILLVLCIGAGYSLRQAEAAPNKQEFPLEEIENFITKEQGKGKIPGMYIVVVKGNQTVYDKGWGWADKEKEIKVTDRTLFELGSNSKSFTGLALLHLEQSGMINLDDPIDKYLPWFSMKYKGEPVVLKLEHFLYQTSGVPFETIGSIPETNDEDGLFQTVRNLMNVELERVPGEAFNYATINYDVLGLVIQEVSGLSYEEYVEQNILIPLQLHDTYVGLHQVEDRERMATGYKMKMFQPQSYEPPLFRGNTPAGYIVSSPEDVAKWLKIQLGDSEIPLEMATTVERSHVPDRTVSPSFDTSSYAAGWQVFQSGGGEWSHAGSNPSFSSFFTLRPEEKWGIAVLSNMNSQYTEEIGKGISSILQGKEPKLIQTDTYKSVDTIASGLIIIMFSASLFFVSSIAYILFKYNRSGQSRKNPIFQWMILVKVLMFFGIIVVGVYYLPTVIFQNLPWEFIKVWGPQTMGYAVAAIIIAGALYLVSQLFAHICGFTRIHSYVSILLMSLLSGFGNAFIIFVINQTFGREGNFTNGLFFSFLFGGILYIVGQRYIRTKLITASNTILYEKRKEITDKILKSSYEKYENTDKGDIYATLNNDTETISRSINFVVNGVTGLFTLLFCFLYLGSLNGFGLLLSIGVILIAAGMHFFIGRRANKIWEQTRNIQNTFFGFIGALMGGFKELKLNKDKRGKFQEDMVSTFSEYRQKRIQGDIQFANIFIIGEMLFTIVIGAVAFLFPLIFTDMEVNTLRSFVFIFLYMTGPVNGILNALPQIIEMRISWKRIQSLTLKLVEEPSTIQVVPFESNNLEIMLNGVTYRYSGRDGKEFSVGPIDYVFRSGEIVFITGGNGSGKSTLAKLLTGLYRTHDGQILINGSVVEGESLSSYFTVIFSDFYLFDRLYGLDVTNRAQEISRLLHKLKLNEKVEIVDGKISTTDLSTGQRKRLALLISYLEDRPICLFDEWAADQDPVFRNIFYNELLPEMKRRGKCVIAITHDDMYFHLSDKLMKLEMGQMI